MNLLHLLLTTLVTTTAVATGQLAQSKSDVTPVPLTTPIRQALTLLGREDQPVVLFDPTEYDDAHRAKLEQFEAFVFKERSEIYLNRRGRAYGDALAGKPEGVYVLAAILAHELAHLKGNDERGALESEQRCIYQFMKERRISVDAALGLLHGVWSLRR
jgi:hypothetical protein